MNNELNNEHSDSYVTPTFTDPTEPEPHSEQHLLGSPEKSHHRTTSMGLSGWELRQKLFDTIENISTFASNFINKIVSRFKKEKVNETGLLPSGRSPQAKIIIPGKPDIEYSATPAKVLETTELLVGNLPDLGQQDQSSKTPAEPVAQPEARETVTKQPLPETIVTGNTQKPKSIENERE